MFNSRVEDFLHVITRNLEHEEGPLGRDEHRGPSSWYERNGSSSTRMTESA